MDALLDDRIAIWLGGAEAMRVIDDASAAVVREEVRARGAAAGLDTDACERLAAAASEVARNQLRHAGGGTIGFRSIARGSVAGLEVIAADRGRGIADPTAALVRAAPAPTPGLGGGLGVGLSAAYRLADEVDFDVRAGTGTCLWLRAFVTPLARSEVAIMSRPCSGESVIGDDATFVRSPDGLIVAVIDGVGHGGPAHDAALRAAAELRARADRSPDEILAAIDTALVSTRGVVMSIARIDHDRHEITHAAAGNVTARVARRDGSVHAFGGVSRTLGTRQPARKISVERTGAHELAALVLYSDGITSGIDLTAQRELLRSPPLVIAHQLIARHARSNDDVTVLVAR
ncbi:MAG TPA: SpoIIE family protein phosphatase [Kofleriaceae bacterium]|nr:SpoIIE family protein phosphatase [Kofleriaceae bacterium]